MDCPNCKKPQPDGAAECSDCGLIFEKWRNRQAAIDTGGYPSVAANSTPNQSYAVAYEPQSEGLGFVGLIGLVFKLALAGGMAYGGYQAYKTYGPVSDACKAYQNFADHWAKGSYQTTKELAIGPALAEVELRLAPPPPAGRAMMGIIGQAFSPQAMNQHAREMVNDMAGSIEKITYMITSEQTQGDTVEISAIQKVQRYGTAAQGALGRPISKFKHEVTLKKEGEAWKVYSFKEEPADLK
ncbi:MAG: hypothetical protein HY401_06975 [Elusimicrobia bacterium]|nr:hypothetical protein [Elusimicrobiota bacterium]